MSEPQDLYDVYYREKLWRLLPQVYRAEDSAGLDSEPGQEFAPGPFRELTDRIGTQAAIVRRSIDRLWEDQSIESCDDWLIPYLADLLATNLISAMDARGQRLDVAKTIYYRRRKGTLGLLEELSRDVTGWDARCVEFFRRLGRARHGLDPPVGLPAAGAADDLDGARALLVAEMLIGPRTSTPAGGFADLRNAAGARRKGSPFDTAFTPEPRDDAAFDEYSHTLDVRRGRGASGWYNIPRLGVFLWRLKSLGVGYSTPVPVSGCPGPRQFTFDPNGRDVPLFAAGTRAYGDAWTSPEPWQLPAPLTRDVLAESLLSLYDVPAAGQPPEAEVRSLGVYLAGAVLPALVPSAQVTADPNDSGAAFRIAPESGRLLAGLLDPGGPLLVTYHYGFPSTIGAGPYDRRDA